MFGLILSLHFLLIELSKGFGSIWHSCIRNEHNTWMLHTFHLLGCKAPTCGIFAYMPIIFAIGTLRCSKLASHCATITWQHDSILRYNNRCLHRTAIIIVSYVASNLLCVLVTLIVSIVHAATILINRETFTLGKAISAVMARCGCTTLNEVVTSCNLFTIGKYNFILRSFNLWCSIPLVTNGSTNIVSSKSCLLGFLLSHCFSICSFG